MPDVAHLKIYNHYGRRQSKKKRDPGGCYGPQVVWPHQNCCCSSALNAMVLKDGGKVEGPGRVGGAWVKASLRKGLMMIGRVGGPSLLG